MDAFRLQIAGTGILIVNSSLKDLRRVSELVFYFYPTEMSSN